MARCSLSYWLFLIAPLGYCILVSFSSLSLLVTFLIPAAESAVGGLGYDRGVTDGQSLGAA